MFKRAGKLIGLIIILIGVSGCQVVQPWERGKLAKPEMGWSNDVLEGRLEAHIYWSKEASSGGSSAAGGGCGCN